MFAIELIGLISMLSVFCCCDYRCRFFLLLLLLLLLPLLLLFLLLLLLLLFLFILLLLLLLLLLFILLLLLLLLILLLVAVAVAGDGVGVVLVLVLVVVVVFVVVVVVVIVSWLVVVVVSCFLLILFWFLFLFLLLSWLHVLGITRTDVLGRAGLSGWYYTYMQQPRCKKSCKLMWMKPIGGPKSLSGKIHYARLKKTFDKKYVRFYFSVHASVDPVLDIIMASLTKMGGQENYGTAPRSGLEREILSKLDQLQ